MQSVHSAALTDWEFKLAYYDARAQHFRHYIKETLFVISLTKILKRKKIDTDYVRVSQDRGVFKA